VGDRGKSREPTRDDAGKPRKTPASSSASTHHGSCSSIGAAARGEQHHALARLAYARSGRFLRALIVNERTDDSIR
jgi:hypothetical protein